MPTSSTSTAPYSEPARRIGPRRTTARIVILASLKKARESTIILEETGKTGRKVLPSHLIRPKDKCQSYTYPHDISHMFPHPDQNDLDSALRVSKNMSLHRNSFKAIYLPPRPTHLPTHLLTHLGTYTHRHAHNLLPSLSRF